MFTEVPPLSTEDIKQIRTAKWWWPKSQEESSTDVDRREDHRD